MPEDTLELAYIPRVDDQGRIEIIFPTVVTVGPTVPKGPCCEVYGPLHQEGPVDDDRYTYLQADYHTTLEVTEPYRKDDHHLDKQLKERLEEVRRDYEQAQEHTDSDKEVEFKRYQRRTEKLRRKFKENCKDVRKMS